MEDEDALVGRDVAFLAAFETPLDSVVQRWVMNAFGPYQARSLTAILPYFPPGTMDRKEEEGDIVTAMSLARDLSVMPSGVSLKNRIAMWDVHNKAEWHFFKGTTCLPIMTSAIPLLLKRLEALPDKGDVSIVFPDEGAEKRFGNKFKGWPKIICEKKRDGNRRIVVIKEGDPRNRHCLIVDDLMQTGGTQDECAKVLWSAAAKCISMYVTHLVAPNDAWERFITTDYRLEHFMATDSCPWTVGKLMVGGGYQQPFEVLSLDDLVVKKIMAVRKYFN